jgi:CYTH domain-containing protein
MVELEKTYLAKFIPANMEGCKFKEIIDSYIPASSEHPVIRLRKNGNTFEITKKQPIFKKDSSVQSEETIVLSEMEFESLNKIRGKKIRKIRYRYKYSELVAEIDVFKDALEGLVLIDFEFKNKKEKSKFKMPDFCLSDVTQEKFLAGGMLAGKKYDEIKEKLSDFGYKKIVVKKYA